MPSPFYFYADPANAVDRYRRDQREMKKIAMGCSACANQDYVMIDNERHLFCSIRCRPDSGGSCIKWADNGKP